VTPDIDWKARSSPKPGVFNSFSQMLSQVHTGWNFESVDDKVTSDRELLAYVKKYSLGDSYLTDILALPMSGCREGKLHDADYLVVSYVVEGNDYSLDVYGHHYALKRGNVFIWNTSQEIFFRSGEMVRQLSVFIPMNAAFNLGKLVSPDTIFVLDKSEAISNILRSTILTLRKNAHNTCISDEPFIVNPILELTKAGVSKARAFRFEKKRSSEQLLDEIRDYVRNNLFDSDLSVATISHALGVSKRYIHQIFSHETESLSRWIARQRLEQATKYLQDSKYRDISITDIAMMTGFNDSGYFSRQFRQHYGMSPKHYRQSAIH